MHFPYQWKKVSLERVLTSEEFYTQEKIPLSKLPKDSESLVNVSVCDHGVLLKDPCTFCEKDTPAIVGTIVPKKEVSSFVSDFLKSRSKVTQ